MGRKHHRPKKEEREKFTSPFWWCSLPSPPWGGGAFFLSPCVGGADFPPLPLLGGVVPLFSQKKET